MAASGDPLDRDPELVATEVREGLISPEAVAVVYGVGLEDSSIDEGGTEERRRAIRDGHDEPSLFDFGPLLDEENLAERIAAERREFEDWFR